MMLMPPCSRAWATPKEAEKSTSPTASSMATTISSSRVRGPSARYWRTTIRVAAGAVAAAMAPRVMAEGIEIAAGKRKWSAIRAASTAAVVTTAWRIPTVMACRPMLRRSERRNSLPMVKAMKPRATSGMMLKPATSAMV